MKSRSAIALLTFLLGITVFASAETTWRNVSSFQVEWDSHPHVQVIMDIPSSWSDPGDFTRIRICVPGQKEFILENRDGWVKYASKEASILPDLLKKRNAVSSQYVLALNATTDGRILLFLLGYSYASSPGSLDVIELSQAGQPRIVLHRKELGLADVRDLDSDGVAEIVGFPCMSQEFGNGLLTYDPLNVYKLATTTDGDARLSIPLSKIYNLEHYYGWAGARCSEDFAVVLHPPNGRKPIVLSTKEAERITQSK